MPEPDGVTLAVEVAYALPHRQWVIPVKVRRGTTVGECIEQSGIVSTVPDIEVSAENVGIFGQLCGLDQVVRQGDRVEIYRALKHDPKALRRRRAREQAESARKKDR